MEAIIDFLNTLTGDSEMVRVLAMSLAAVTATVFTLGVAYLLLGVSDPIRRRISNVTVAESGAPLNGRQRVTIQTMMGPIAKFILPKEEVDRSKTNKQLIYAGFTGPNALANYYAIKAILLIGLPALFLLASQWMPSLPTTFLILYTACAAGVGIIAPSIALDRFVERRQKALRNGFPDSLDLMVVCVEAGLGLAQSIQRVADELSVSHPELATEMALVTAEMRAGVDNVIALKNLGERTGLDDIRGLVSTLVQTLRFGTGVADALRIYSDEFRDKRMQAAEERAAKMGTKMIFPLILFMFPSFFIVAIGPAVLKMMDTFSKL